MTDICVHRVPLAQYHNLVVFDRECESITLKHIFDALIELRGLGKPGITGDLFEITGETGGG